MMTQENSGRAGRMKAAARLEELRLINGHPLQTMLRECDAIEGKTAEIRACIPEHDFEQIHSGLLELRSAAAHFSKKRGSALPGPACEVQCGRPFYSDVEHRCESAAGSKSPVRPQEL